MKIFSFQHKEVINQIITEGVYKCSYVSKYRNQAPLLYGVLQEFIYKKTNIDSFPIFGWSKIENIDESSTIEDVILNTCYKVGFDSSSHLLLELEIPDEYIIQHDFYDFASFKLDEEEGLCGLDDLRNFIYSDISTNSINIQATFPIILKEWVTNVYSYSFSYQDKFKYKIENVYIKKLKL